LGPGRCEGGCSECRGEGNVYVCAIKDVYSSRIVGYSIDSRMKACLAVQALDNAVV
jgi:putative transposase